MTIKEVHSPKDWKLFHRVPHLVYQNDPNWIAPLEMEVQHIFTKGKNTALNKGEAQCFVLLDGSRTVGRIAAFIDYERHEEQPYKEGGIGFFECLNRPEYADALFHAAENYLAARGVEVIDGPVNFGERDKFWGLLVKNFAPPLYQENYNPPYYRQFFLDHGYQPFEQILTFAGDSRDIPFERLRSVSRRLQERHPMYVKGFSFQELDRFARDFTEVYNASFRSFEHFHPVSAELVHNMMTQAKPIIDPHIACIAYYQDHPAGFVALYPDINPLLKHAKGKLNWRTIPLFLLKKRFTRRFNAKGMGLGIHPDFQSKGIFALLMDFLCSDRNVERYPRMYLATIRAHNHQIRSIYEKLNVNIDRVHVAYRKTLKPDIEIIPFEFIPEAEL